MEKLEPKELIKRFRIFTNHCGLSDMDYNEKTETFTLISDNGNKSKLKVEIVACWMKDLETIDEKSGLIKELVEKNKMLQKQVNELTGKLVIVQQKIKTVCDKFIT